MTRKFIFILFQQSKPEPPLQTIWSKTEWLQNVPWLPNASSSCRAHNQDAPLFRGWQSYSYVFLGITDNPAKRNLLSSVCSTEYTPSKKDSKSPKCLYVQDLLLNIWNKSRKLQLLWWNLYFSPFLSSVQVQLFELPLDKNQKKYLGLISTKTATAPLKIAAIAIPSRIARI